MAKSEIPQDVYKLMANSTLKNAQEKLSAMSDCLDRIKIEELLAVINPAYETHTSKMMQLKEFNELVIFCAEFNYFLQQLWDLNARIEKEKNLEEKLLEELMEYLTIIIESKQMAEFLINNTIQMLNSLVYKMKMEIEELKMEIDKLKNELSNLYTQIKVLENGISECKREILSNIESIFTKDNEHINTYNHITIELPEYDADDNHIRDRVIGVKLDNHSINAAFTEIIRAELDTSNYSEEKVKQKLIEFYFERLEKEFIPLCKNLSDEAMHGVTSQIHIQAKKNGDEYFNKIKQTSGYISSVSEFDKMAKLKNNLTLANENIKEINIKIDDNTMVLNNKIKNLGYINDLILSLNRANNTQDKIEVMKEIKSHLNAITLTKKEPANDSTYPDLTSTTPSRKDIPESKKIIKRF